MNYPELVERVIGELSKLPGIGRKSAERIVFYLLDRSKDEVKQLASAIYYMRDKIRFCELCNNFSQERLCKICSDPKRDGSVICIVEKPSDVAIIEKAGYYRGRYYVLLGAVSPVSETKADLKLDKLVALLKGGEVKEVIIATDTDAEGELTSIYLQELLGKFPVEIYRIGMGIPVGVNLEYMDAVTIAKAIESRTKLN